MLTNKHLFQFGVFLLALVGAYTVSGQRSNTRAVQAMTLVFRESAAHPNEQPIEVDKLFAVDRQGSRTNLTQPSSKHKTGQEARNVFLTPERKYVVIADAIRAISTFPLTKQKADSAKLITISERCEESGLNPVGETKLLDFAAYAYTQSRRANRLSRSTSWRAPTLDCRELRYLEEQLDENGQVTHTFERVATKVTLGDPDPALFLIPGGYREIPPSQANLELMERRAGKPIDGPTLQRMKPAMIKMDEHYQEGRRVAQIP